MKGISDLKLVGIDASRPPVIRKEPYIELYFKLNQEAPLDWLKEFNDFVKNGPYPIKIKPDDSSTIETWVRTSAEVKPAFNEIKNAVHTCIKTYVDRALAQKQTEQVETGVSLSKEQLELNKIIESLDFDQEEAR
ncbi:hypothetical protein [Pleionea sediminis]|uniref:hypothetical protein n=1 Tax=Pleionea sediminis TaxID=2569479 RepID=UPI00118481D1|nr:hypothetical protein [Pleionea sediminis]